MLHIQESLELALEFGGKLFRIRLAPFPLDPLEGGACPPGADTLVWFSARSHQFLKKVEQEKVHQVEDQDFGQLLCLVTPNDELRDFDSESLQVEEECLPKLLLGQNKQCDCMTMASSSCQSLRVSNQTLRVCEAGQRRAMDQGDINRGRGAPYFRLPSTFCRNLSRSSGVCRRLMRLCSICTIRHRASVMGRKPIPQVSQRRGCFSFIGALNQAFWLKLDGQVKKRGREWLGGDWHHLRLSTDS